VDETRRYRGLIRMSLTAGAAMATVATGALAIGLATGLVPTSIFGPRELIAVAIRAFGFGAVAGGVFAWFVSRGAHGQTLLALSTRRVAWWGGLATASVPLLALLAAGGAVVPIGVVAAATLLAGIGGSVVSASMLRLARRGEKRLDAADARPDHLLP
jgi:hypothetical protein